MPLGRTRQLGTISGPALTSYGEALHNRPKRRRDDDPTDGKETSQGPFPIYAYKLQ
jgi:hypothetical protein